jgi:two-component system, LytTR family, sensor kinase
LKKIFTIIVHIAAWACLFLLPFVFFPRPRDPNFHFSEPFIMMLVCLDSFLVAFFYLNTEVFIPRLLARRKALWYSLVILACLVAFMYIPRLFDDAIWADMPDSMKAKIAERIKRKSETKTLFPNPFKGSNAVFFFVFTISTLMKVMQQWRSAEKNKQEIEQDKVVTELSFLKTQINPHFLFNTLNNIYSLAIVKSDATAGAVLKLSSIMRYVLNETKNHWVPLANEVKFIEDYIQLQQVRLTDKVTIIFDVEGNIDNKMIAPLLLIPFVENAFKYGISTKENSTIEILLVAGEHTIECLIKNKIVATTTDTFENNGIGIKNTQRRLELLYPGKHQLLMTQENNEFIVNLILNT